MRIKLYIYVFITLQMLQLQYSEFNKPFNGPDSKCHVSVETGNRSTSTIWTNMTGRII